MKHALVANALGLKEIYSDEEFIRELFRQVQ